jgi:eukaryotic-like serine/threonine-protein kinase
LTAADDTQPSVRSIVGRVCPHCRLHDESPVDPGVITRCRADGFALVPAESLADADGDPFLGTTVAGRFVILGRLGAGSMGTVYRARQEAMLRDVAVKILRSDRAFDSQAKGRFAREARAMSLLTSPHTVTVFDFGELPDPNADELASGVASLYLAMELLEGESLGQRLKRKGRIPVPEAVRIARHALLSLAEAHDKGVIHRDLKPDNLFLARVPGGESEECCKVLDFGIAKVATGGVNGVDALETQAGTVFGTPRYMSPEQAQGKALDSRSDLYSLGVLLYQMLTGRAPFVDDDAVVVMARHIKSTPVPPAEAAPDARIGARLSAVVMRALSKDPNDRPASARQLIAELERALPPSPGATTAERSGAEAAVAATGDVAVVRDGLDDGVEVRAKAAARWGLPRMALPAAALVLLASLAWWVAGFGPLRGKHGPAARTGVGQAVAGWAQRLAQGAAAASAPVEGSAAPASPAAATAEVVMGPAATTQASSTAAPAPSLPPRRPLHKGYKRFE